MKKILVLLTLIAACHRGSPIVQADLAAPQAPPDLLPPPPAMPMLTLDGKKVDFAAYRKRVTLVAFWGTFCAPCLKELPMLSALHDKMKRDSDLSIVAVSTDEVGGDADRAHVAEVANQMKLTIPVLIDVQGKLAATFAYKDGETPDAGSEQGLDLPTLVTWLSNGHYARHSGFDMDMSQETFISNGMATIVRAEAGTLPDDEYDSTPPPAEGGSFKMMIPALSREDFAKQWPGIEKQLQGHSSPAELAAAKAQLMAGKPTVIEIPMPPKKK